MHCRKRTIRKDEDFTAVLWRKEGVATGDGNHNDSRNGEVNGYVNGEVNGYVNGYVNGTLNGTLSGTDQSVWIKRLDG